jgi:hypothetical protein
MKHKNSEDRFCIFAVVAWLKEDIGLDGIQAITQAGNFRRWKKPALRERLANEGSQLPSSIVPLHCIRSIVHIFHDCGGHEVAQQNRRCHVKGHRVVHDEDNDKWLQQT